MNNKGLWNTNIVEDFMIGRLEKQLQVLQTQRNILFNLNSKMVTQESLPPFSSTIQSITTVSSLLISTLTDILQPSQIQCIFDTLIFTLQCATSQLAVVCPLKPMSGEKQKNENLCSICSQNIHENNIKEAKIGLQKDHRQKFRMAMEQFNRLSSEEIFTHDQDAMYENELYKHLLQKQKIFNMKTNRVQQFINIMDSTLLALKNIQEVHINESQMSQKYSRISSIDTYIAQFLQNSFSKKIPPWIQKLLAKFLEYEKAHAMSIKSEYSTQTTPMITDDHRQLAKEKKVIEKEFRKQSKQYAEIKTCYEKLEKINKQLSQQLAQITRTMQNKKSTNTGNRSKGEKKTLVGKNSVETSEKVSSKVSQKEISPQNEDHDRQLHSFIDSVDKISKGRRSNPSGLFPKIRTSRIQDSIIQSTLKALSDKEPIERNVKSKFKHKSSIQPFENNIVEQNYENELEDYVEVERMSSIHQIPQQISLSKEDQISEIQEDYLSYEFKTNKRSAKAISKKKITRVNTKLSQQQSNLKNTYNQSIQNKNQKEQIGFKNQEKTKILQTSSQQNGGTDLSERSKGVGRKNTTVQKITPNLNQIENNQNIEKAGRISEELKAHAQEYAEKILEKMKRCTERQESRDKNIVKDFQSLGMKKQEIIPKHRMNQREKIRKSTPILQNLNSQSLKNNKHIIKQNSAYGNTNKNGDGDGKKQRMVVYMKNGGVDKMKVQIKGQSVFEILKQRNFMPESMTYQQFEKIFDSQKQQEDKENQNNDEVLADNGIVKCIFQCLFIDNRQSIKYEQSQQKSYHKKNIPPLTQPQRNLCASIFHMINSLKTKSKTIYKTISALLRSPYQTMFNNIRFVNFISQMQQETFQYYFRRILRIHRKCPLAVGQKCKHLQEVEKILLSIKKY